MKKSIISLILLLLVVIIFFKPFFFKNLLPIPSDTTVGLYHPFRDLYAKEYPRGIPFKNFLITDPVRQQYPWRELAISLEKKIQLPLWNQYNFSGTPLIANFQSAAFYPLNILFFLLPFPFAWSLLIVFEPLFGGIFLYLYLKNLKLHSLAALLGAISFAFSGFFIAWLEWNTLIHVVLWLPLILLAKDRLLEKWNIRWIILFLFAECSAVFAGHVQMLFYTLCISNVYLLVRILQVSQRESVGIRNILLIAVKKYIPFLIAGLVLFTITAIQWLPTFQFIDLSARDVDLSSWQNVKWFVPWQHLIQFIFPDFFGNPTTLNYWGVWNYGEFVGYIGMVPFLLALFSLFFRRDKKTLFFGTLFFLSLLFALPTIFAKIPFIFSFPFLSTAQPTRLLFVTDFSLAVLAALGFDLLLKNKKGIFYPWIFLFLVVISVEVFVFTGDRFHFVSSEHLAVAKHNTYFPLAIFITLSALLISAQLLKKFFHTTVLQMFYCSLIFLTVFDLLRFADKFIPFTQPSYLYPNTQAISFLQKNIGIFRYMTTDDRLLPPNFSARYRLQSIDGYDPLYLRRYGEFIASSQRGKPNIARPFGFNRIITPHNYKNKIIDLLGVKYILSLSDLTSNKLQKVFQEGQTQVYENKDVLPRAFFVKQVQIFSDKQKAIEHLFDKNLDMQSTAVVECTKCAFLSSKEFGTGDVSITHYSENIITIQTKTTNNSFLILTDSYYPTWHASIDGKETKIYLADFNFRGMIVPKGRHTVIFYDRLL